MEFSKEALEFVSNIGDDQRKILTPVTNNASNFSPGDILLFTYKMPGAVGRTSGEERVFMVLKGRRGPGIFKSTRGNTLVMGVKLDTNRASIEVIVENLYKKRRKASYYGKIMKSLESLIGKESFRTYNIQGMGNNLHKVNIRG
jgi:hypothetical protein